jgi:hypothetical protein
MSPILLCSESSSNSGRKPRLVQCLRKPLKSSAKRLVREKHPQPTPKLNQKLKTKEHPTPADSSETADSAHIFSLFKIGLKKKVRKNRKRTPGRG